MELLALLKTGWGTLRAALPIALVLTIGVLAAVIHVRTGQRDALQVWQDDVKQATRDAANRPKLATSGVAQQIRYLGNALEKVRTGMAQARAEALAAKAAKEAADESRRKEFDHALATALDKALSGSDAYARDHGVWSDAGRPAAAAGSNDSGADLPGRAGPAEVADRSGSGPALVSIPRTAFDTCTPLKVRLDNGHAWALEQVP
jgi:hypothetical protein